jgi:hypothetical protein
VKYSLGLRVVIIKVVNKASNRRASLAKLLSKLSKSNSILYYISSLSLVYSLSEELGGEESSN